MRRGVIFVFTTLFCMLMSAQNRPGWVSQHPVNEFGFAGVGMAKKSEPNYQQKAKQNALADLASEIKVEISTNSLLNTIEDDGHIKQVFAESIRTTAQAEIEKFRQVDSWQNDEEYWVYYELNRFDYEEYMEARRQKAIRDGFDFWYRGNIMLEQGDLMSGIELLTKAMEAIKPALNQELLCSYDGNTINLATEVYASLAGMFNGVAVVLNPSTVAGTAFKGITDPIAIGVYRNGNPLKNVRLDVAFVSGSGDLSSPSPTDESGVAALYVRNITSKQAQQEIQISISTDAFKPFLKGVNGVLFKKAFAMLPEATLTVNMEQQQLSAYVKSVQSDMDALERNVKNLLTNNFFNVVSSPAEADVIVTLDNKFKKGKIIPGELYNFVECFSTLGIQILDNRTGAVALNYSLNDIRTLVPENKSVAQAKSMAARELLKRMNREFDRELKKITIDRTGDIPAREYEQDGDNPLPTPVVDEAEPLVKPAETAPQQVLVPVIVQVPVKEPEPEYNPRPQAKPRPQTKQQASKTPVKEPEPVRKPAAIRGELTDGIWVEYSQITDMGDKSRIHFKVINKTSDDFTLRLYHSNQTVVNENGEEMSVTNMKLGSKSERYDVTALIVPNLPTDLVIEVKKLKSVALFGLKDNSNRTLKLRNLK